MAPSRLTLWLVVAIVLQPAASTLDAHGQDHVPQQFEQEDAVVAAPLQQQQTPATKAYLSKASRVEYMKALKFAELKTLHAAIQYETRMNLHKKMEIQSLLKKLHDLEAQAAYALKTQAPIIERKMKVALKAAHKEFSERNMHIEALQSKISKVQSLNMEKLYELDGHEQLRRKQSAEITKISGWLHKTAAQLKVAQAAARNPSGMETDIGEAHADYLAKLKHTLQIKHALEQHEKARAQSEETEIEHAKARLASLTHALADGTGAAHQAVLAKQLAALQAEMGRLSVGLKNLKQIGGQYDADINLLQEHLLKSEIKSDNEEELEIRSHFH